MEYPVALEFDADLKVANWRPLVQWLLGIPHLLIAQVLGQVAAVVAAISWFAILFTGTMPPGFVAFQCLVIRYNARAYSYALWLRQSYPAFEFPMGPADPRTDPVRVDIVPPEGTRNRLTVGLRFLWIIPIALFGFAVSLAAFAVSVASFFAVLFTGNYPVGMRDFMVRCGRLFVRVSAYGYLLTDEYPPFALE